MDHEAESAAMIEAAHEMNRRVILVDGFNVLHASLLGEDRNDPAKAKTLGWWKREYRERLLSRLTSWNSGPDEIWVAFDGNQPAMSVWPEPVPTASTSSSTSEPEPESESESGDGTPGARATTAPSETPTIHSLFVESADDWIVRRARRTSQPERVVVVSADRKVAGRARSAGCEVWTPWHFMGLCTPEVSPEGNPEKQSKDTQALAPDGSPQGLPKAKGPRTDG